MIERFFDDKLNEEYCLVEHDLGLKVYLCPKKDYNSSYAIFGAKYGSINDYYNDSNNKTVKIPPGTAHYLEHKLFEGKNQDVFKLYNETGASVNAYTSFDKTAYLFHCNENFLDSLKILLDFVQEPYFTEQNVEKEREIINQEIKMYQDDPGSRVCQNLLKKLYLKHPVRNEIAGTTKSISEINSEILYKCYNNFYNLNNMSLCIVGNFDTERSLECIFQSLKARKNSSDTLIRNLFEKEPDLIESDYISENMEISVPVFSLGFKECVKTEHSSMRDMIISEIILCAFTLKSGKVYNELLDSGKINISSFSCEHFSGPFFSSFIFSGESEDPNMISDLIKKNVDYFCGSGMSNEVFARAKKCVYAENLSNFNSISCIANTLFSFSFLNYKLFEYINQIEDIDLNEINECIRHKFRNDFSVLSVVKGKD